jgi:monoterpene epsilon-lactone hydrolase
MSLRAEILRLAIRLIAKRSASPTPDIGKLRRCTDRIKPLIPGPSRETTAHRLSAGGVPALHVATAQSRPDRHVLYLHGGGYVFGSVSHYRDFIWRIADAAQARVLCIDYRLAPEHKFPAAVDDAVAAYRWLLAQGAKSDQTAIMGDSAGGGLALAALLRLRDEGASLPKAAVALSPWTDLAVTAPSYAQNEASDPMLVAAQARYYAACYLGGADPRHPYASPLYGDPTGLPPCLIQVGSDEILHDDAVRMAERLRAAGCRVVLEVWPRMPHVFQLFARILPEARDAIAHIGAFLRAEWAGGDGRP